MLLISLPYSYQVDFFGPSHPALQDLCKTWLAYQSFLQRAVGLVDMKQWRQRRLFDMDLMTEVGPPTREWLEDQTRRHATTAEVDTWPICKAYQVTARRLRDEAEVLQQQYRDLMSQQGLSGVTRGDGIMPSAPGMPLDERMEALLSRIRVNELEQRLAESDFVVSSHHGLDAKDGVERALKIYPLR